MKDLESSARDFLSDIVRNFVQKHTFIPDLCVVTGDIVDMYDYSKLLDGKSI